MVRSVVLAVANERDTITTSRIVIYSYANVHVHMISVARELHTYHLR